MKEILIKISTIYRIRKDHIPFFDKMLKISYCQKLEKNKEHKVWLKSRQSSPIISVLVWNQDQSIFLLKL